MAIGEDQAGGDDEAATDESWIVGNVDATSGADHTADRVLEPAKLAIPVADIGRLQIDKAALHEQARAFAAGDDHGFQPDMLAQGKAVGSLALKRFRQSLARARENLLL